MSDHYIDEVEFTNDLIYALKGLAPNELGEAFGEDAGLCWCNPFYRGESWPGHDEACTWIRNLLRESGLVEHERSS